MKAFSASLWAEWLKVRRSKMFAGMLSVFAFVGIMMGFMMFAAQHPEISGRSPALAAKTSAIGKGDWPNLLALLVQTILALGAMGFGIVTSWVFGREFSDRTLKDLLSLPVSRPAIVAAKFFIILVWSLMLSLALFAAALLTALALPIPGWSPGLVMPAFKIFCQSALLTILLCTPVALIAGIGRGYLPPIGFVVLTLIITQLVGIGMPVVAVYFPWAYPALVSGAAGDAVPKPGAASLVIYLSTVAAGYILTVAWWQNADHT
ncbi:MAG TPA: ABC transporter permease [Chitinivibrionales bacterium]|nr:ABC transporter permease [Chitinivibrionales bacterium]